MEKKQNVLTANQLRRIAKKVQDDTEFVVLIKADLKKLTNETLRITGASRVFTEDKTMQIALHAEP